MRQFGPTPLLNRLAPCGSAACNGCYDVGDGRKIHPPRPSAKFLNRKGGEFIEERPALKIKKGRKTKKSKPKGDNLWTPRT